MQPARSIGVLFVSTLVMIAGLWSVAPLAQVSPPPTETIHPPNVTMAPPASGHPTFLVVSHGGKCLDFDYPPQVGGAPVFLRTCYGGDSAQDRKSTV